MKLNSFPPAEVNAEDDTNIFKRSLATQRSTYLFSQKTQRSKSLCCRRAESIGEVKKTCREISPTSLWPDTICRLPDGQQLPL